MKRRSFLIALFIASCSPQEPKAPEQGAAISDPAEVIREVYEPYLTPSPFPEFRNQAPWSADLWAQIEAMMARSQALNEPILDFDPLIGAQDGELSALMVTTDAVVENSHAAVRAHFNNLGREEEIVYDLIWEGGGWRVDNVRGRDWDLRQIVAQPGGQ